MRKLTRIAAALTLAVGGSLAGVSAASAGPYTHFGSATGIQQVSFTQASVDYDAYFNRSGSGIVQQWRQDPAPYGLYQLFKPITSAGVTTPFKEVCDSTGLWTGGGFAVYYASGSGIVIPKDSVLNPFFSDGVRYWVCSYDLYDHAQGDVTYHAAGATPDRHAVYSVHEASPFGPAGGTFTYSDSNLVTYTVSVDAVYIDGNTVIFSGQIDDGDVLTVDPWLIVKAVDTGTGIEQYGDVVASDPAASLTTHVFSIQAFDTAGTLTIYTR